MSYYQLSIYILKPMSNLQENATFFFFFVVKQKIHELYGAELETFYSFSWLF